MYVEYFIEFEDFRWKKVKIEYSWIFYFSSWKFVLRKKIVENFNISTNDLISVEVAKEGNRVLYCSSTADVGTYNHVGDWSESLFQC